MIDTIGQKVGPLSWTDGFGIPFTPALHVIERYRLIDGAMARDLQQKNESELYRAIESLDDVTRDSRDFIGAEYGPGDIDPDITKPGLQVEITVDDPDTFTAPWSALITYRHALGQWPEIVCAENTREAGRVRQMPHAENPDF